jgi:hypothetical protein
MYRISDQVFIKQVFSNVDLFSTLDTQNALFLLEVLNKKLLELTVNTFMKSGKGIEVDSHQSHQFFTNIFDLLNIQPNSIRVKIEASYIYLRNCSFLWQTNDDEFVNKRNLDNIKNLVELGILVFDPIHQIKKKDLYSISEFTNQPVLISLPRKIQIPIDFSNKHYRVDSITSKKYISLLKKLSKNPSFLKNSDIEFTICVLIDLTLQRLYSLIKFNQDDYIRNVKHYLDCNVLDNKVTLLHPNNLILGYLFTIEHLRSDERNKFLLELLNARNTLEDVKSCLERYGVTLVNEKL